MLGKSLITAAAGAVGGALNIADVFSTSLYTGNGGTQTITNGLDLAGKGGMTWFKRRTTQSTPPNNANDYLLLDSERSVNVLSSNKADAQYSGSTGYTQLSTGFSLSTSTNTNPNANGGSYVSWSICKAPKFFDVVTYTGTGANRTVAHNLGSVPGTIIVKRTNTSGDWQVYHRSLANTEYLVLNSTTAKTTGTTRWNSTTPTSTVFSLGTDTTVNASGGTYVAYLFAHETGDDSVIQCGSFTNSGNPSINLGWEPQWILYKAADATADWYIQDTERGLATSTSSSSATLRPHLSNAEFTRAGIARTSTGFNIDSSYFNSGTHIYVVIKKP